MKKSIFDRYIIDKLGLKMPDLDDPLPLEEEQQQSIRDSLNGSFFRHLPLLGSREV